MHLRLLAPALALLALSGCATTGLIPTASFHGMRVQTVQEDPDSKDLKLRLGLDFKVENPLALKLSVPEHSFALEIDGAPAAESGTHGEFAVPARGSQVVSYDFVLDMGPKGLGAAVGKDAEFAFSAEADLDLPGRVVKTIEDNAPDLGGLLGEAAGAAGEALSGLKLGNGGDGKTQARLAFGHGGRLKLPKVPKIEAPAGEDKPEVSLVGKSETMSLDNLLGDLREAGGPLVDLLTKFLSREASQSVDLPVGELLQLIGVPRDLTSGAVTALNTFLSLQGSGSVKSSSSKVAVPVKLPNLRALMTSIDSKAVDKVDAFTQSWGGFSTATLGGEGGLIIPTSLPSGIRVAAPFAIRNTNEFSILTPTFRLAIVDGAGTTLASVGALPAEAAAAADDLTRSAFRSVAIDGSAVQPMRLLSEVHWEALTGGLLQMAASGAPAPLDAAGLRLVGEVTVDPGYGPITVPLSVPLAAPVAGPSDGSGTESGSSSKKGRK